MYEKQKETTRDLLALSHNGCQVVYDPVHSHAATHLQDTPPLKSLVCEIIKNLDFDRKEVARHFDMGRVVGTSDVVATDATDDIVYGMRRNRADDGLVPFTKSRPAEPCSSVAVHIIPRGDDDTYELVSAWIGTYGDDAPFPDSVYATEGSVAYWTTHAFVYGSQEIVAGTETTEFPW